MSIYLVVLRRKIPKTQVFSRRDKSAKYERTSVLAWKLMRQYFLLNFEEVSTSSEYEGHPRSSQNAKNAISPWLSWPASHKKRAIGLSRRESVGQWDFSVRLDNSNPSCSSRLALLSAWEKWGWSRVRVERHKTNGAGRTLKPAIAGLSFIVLEL